MEDKRKMYMETPTQNIQGVKKKILRHLKKYIEEKSTQGIN